MFLRKKKNKSGSTSVQIISKARGKYKVVKTIGAGTGENEIEKLLNLGRQEMEHISKQPKSFVSEKDNSIEEAFSVLTNSNIRTVGPELIFGKIYESTPKSLFFCRQSCKYPVVSNRRVNPSVMERVVYEQLKHIACFYLYFSEWTQ